VETAAISQAPLMPRASVGLPFRTVTAVKKVYMTTNHKSSPNHHSTVAIPVAATTIMFCVPRTHVLATIVKKPGAL